MGASVSLRCADPSHDGRCVMARGVGELLCARSGERFPGTPRRERRSRARGARLPAGTICVTRGTRWGNPFLLDGTVDERQAKRWGWNVPRLRTMAGMHPLSAFESALRSLTPDALAALRHHLGGRNLACWCNWDQACHGDVLLLVSNEPTP